MSDYPLTLLYDGACPLCVAEMGRLMARNRRGLLRFVDASAPSFDPARYGVERAEIMRIMHGVRADGSVVTAIDAIRLSYAAAGLGPVAWVLGVPGVRQIAGWAYPLLAKHRYRVSRWLGWLLPARAAQAPCDSGVCDPGSRPREPHG